MPHRLAGYADPLETSWALSLGIDTLFVSLHQHRTLRIRTISSGERVEYLSVMLQPEGVSRLERKTAWKLDFTQASMDSVSNTLSATSSCIPDAQSRIGQSGQGIGNTAVWVSASSVPPESSFLLIYSVKHEMQYVCWPGHGRRRPYGSLAREFAASDAESGDRVTWNCSRQMPHIG